MFILILHNIRSAYNVGSLFRTADGFGVEKIYLTGYSAVPKKPGSIIETQANKMLSKTALGAENNVSWERVSSISKLIKKLKKQGVKIVALEQYPKSIDFKKFTPEFPLALIPGNEVRGLDKRILIKCDAVLEIPMHGKKNSLNVSVATGIIGYELARYAKMK